MFVAQPKGFEDPLHPNDVYKLKKALYGIKQTPRTWYERLTSTFYKGGALEREQIVLSSSKGVKGVYFLSKSMCMT